MEKSPNLIKRQSPQGLPHCCFIFDGPTRSGDRKTYFRVYSEDRQTFTDYDIASNVTPFVYFKYPDDVELKEYQLEDGSIQRIMDFPEHALSGGAIPVLKPGEIWTKDGKDVN